MSDPNSTVAIADRAVQKSKEADARAAAADESARQTEAEGLDALADDDALDLLLAAEPAEQVQTVELDPRKGTEKPLFLTLRSITENEWKEIQDQSEIRRGSREQRRRGRQRGEETELNNALMARLLVKKATVNVNWNDSALRSKFKVQSGEEVIQKVLLYGEVANLAGIITTISGFDDDAIQFVGNSSNEAVKLGS